MKSKHSFTLSQLAELCDVELSGNGSELISGIGTIGGAKKGEITFLANSLYRDSLKNTQASAVILSTVDQSFSPTHCLISANPYATYAKVAQLLFPFDEKPSRVHSSAVVADDVVLPQSISIGAHVVIESGVRLGEGVVIEAGCYIGQDCVIGNETYLYPHVTLYHQTQIGQRAIVHSGVVVGSDGFGMAWDKGKWIKIPQIGQVIIGDDVEIGANTTIDRGAIDNTIIEDGVKLDNQIQIAHNCHVGAHTVIAGCTGVSGSTKIGKHCRIGGGVGIVGHLEICDGVTVTGFTMITKSITEPGVYSSGVPGAQHKEWLETLVYLRHLPDWAKRIKALEKVTKKEE
ncbi:UDP-3-O-(3-hydroxymyristoyl)glucosamine N-acyltransferase [Ferrovum sp. PN-J185]|uniref:UDP-3-O-(3-hydroxymyristoyl)glucosamine N-acyltransferase n=1 Tax=Ferrovum sp. PN-J185 TaxID=1356306 RepID=UPI00079B4321|nr:UDP-3-O-(3-hydroxymyristoyl)glucosamine N-acyltransferase [Ferrovum sp. PN-J185]KXW56313.1 UDP-3-O-acylglucosamine N-acyltransferase [Ferrovum sp. PN-J185]MCC6069037.1 UDP-3-O-(3-hydroxymyristoyl)glucosamine N-acyltransferase [Ferrovum sp. PN-J185]MDE1890983.1 UDP-3-O-(3-hydroxymyristoyl)glucosamine N-acyltransferase [Betaproteobacteria bacterium]MDE2055705.1 UDP-3-O-(3-hydroxymyristoyl)glucosamine N-acyltransferase [Betaproteobacteria bacterium]